MKLLQQFPDVSVQIRLLNEKHIRKEIGSKKEHNDNGKELDLYYDNEFKKWHIKLALIIALIITCLFVVLVGVSKVF